MKLPLIIHAWLLGIYLFITLPALTDVRVYEMSSLTAFSLIVISAFIFALLFEFIKLINPPYYIALLCCACWMALPVVITLTDKMPDDAWFTDRKSDTLFSITLSISGLVAIIINSGKIKHHFIMENELQS